MKESYPIENRRILIGVTGGISAYKTAELVRLCKKARAEVKVVMTEGAQAFITPLTFQALSGEAVRCDLLDPSAEMGMGHIELARWAEIIIIAPASANFIARLAHGFSDDLLTTVCLATAAPIIIAPAMNQRMWAHAATQCNVELLVQRGIQCVGPAAGDQACGDVGLGRMVEPEQMATVLEKHFIKENVPKNEFSGIHILITAGPTQEPIDPVRFISNRSSGKMGYALATVAAQRGAQVTLVSGPVVIPVPSHKGLSCESVVTAEQMYDAVMKHLATTDIFISAAAVADYRVKLPASQKIKKNTKLLTHLELVPNKDILNEVSHHVLRPQWVIGFAAETHDLLSAARQKLVNKNLDMIIVNQVGDQNNKAIGFESDANTVTIVTSHKEIPLPLTSKVELAEQIMDYIFEIMS